MRILPQKQKKEVPNFFFFSIEKNERAFSVKKAKIQDKSEPLTINLIHEFMNDSSIKITKKKVFPNKIRKYKLRHN